MYGSSVDDYFIQQYDQELGGDTTSDVPWIEHVLPATYSEEWNQFTIQEHNQLKDVAANLIPLSSAMNASLGNKAYAVKQPVYRKDSMFKSARDFADKYDSWTPLTLGERGENLAKWAVQRWPHVRPTAE